MKEKELEMIAYEGFIRRAVEVNYPFMLKGSYVTRQYFPNPEDRIPADLDWVYLEKLDDVEGARQVFDAWIIAITELELDDRVKFRSFTKNQFWRMIDYAMADDFPTVNTDLKCWVDGVELDFCLDISFNLEIEPSAIPLTYKALDGSSFVVPYTVPISLQVAWKIHQTLVRPRFKDLFDLMYLVQHQSFDDKALKDCLQALVNECSVDNVNMGHLRYFLNYDMIKLFPKKTMNKTWEYWRHKIEEKSNDGYYIINDRADYITDASKLPKNLPDFLKQFREIMERCGFDIHLMDRLAKAKIAKKKNPIILDLKQSEDNETENDEKQGLLNAIKGLFKI